MKTKKTPVQWMSLLICEAVAAVTLICMVRQGEHTRILTAAGTVLLVLLPELAQRCFSCRLSLPAYLFSLFYAMGPMIGQCWNLYYTVSWWDKLLHISGGVVFAVIGVYLYESIAPDHKKPAVTALFGLLFSMTVAVVWEFAEFGMDMFLGMDMQNDTVVNGFSSYLLSETVGQTVKFENICSVAVNGVLLPAAGYVDVGLIDTMVDMLVEGAGALVTCLLLCLDGGKHPLIRFNQKGRE